MLTTLIVIYTDRLQECADFYTGLGLPLQIEQHGNGPKHHAAVLGPTVLELYPTSQRRPATGSLRLGFRIPAHEVDGRYAPGRHLLTDPDGRTVDLEITTEETNMNEHTAQQAIAAALGPNVEADIKTLPAGLAITLTTLAHTATIDGNDQEGWGYTIDGADEEAFTGHRHNAPTLDEALAAVSQAFAH